MKKIIWKIFLSLLIIQIFRAVRPIRTPEIMEDIAKEKLMCKDNGILRLFSYNGEVIYKGIKGPIINDRQERVEYTWYKVLEWGDTARVSSFVYKNVFMELAGIFRAKNPPDVTANSQWDYVYLESKGRTTAKFSDIFPDSVIYPNDTTIYKLHPKQYELKDTIKFIVSPRLLFYFLKKGYYFVMEKHNDYTIVEFYEPIANITSRKSNDTTYTIFAKVFFNDSLQIFILPYDAPLELLDRWFSNPEYLESRAEAYQ